MGKSKRLAAPREENYQTYEKDNNTNKKKMYLLKSIQNVNKTAAIFYFAITEWYSVNRTTIIFV